jgi:hypothetical protein
MSSLAPSSSIRIAFARVFIVGLALTAFVGGTLAIECAAQDRAQSKIVKPSLDVRSERQDTSLITVLKSIETGVGPVDDRAPESIRVVYFRDPDSGECFADLLDLDIIASVPCMSAEGNELGQHRLDAAIPPL